MYDRILVAMDGSDRSERAAQHALSPAELVDAEIHALHVVDTRRHGESVLSSVELLTDALEDRGCALLDGFAAQADERGVDAEVRCERRTPHEAIVAYADSADADLVVLGFRGQSHATGHHLGSVTDRVLRLCDRPVLVV